MATEIDLERDGDDNGAQPNRERTLGDLGHGNLGIVARGLLRGHFTSSSLQADSRSISIV